jgi:5'-3' exonuclease
MILHDFSNLTHRLLFTSVLNAQKSGDLKTKSGDLHDMNVIKPFFLHLLFNNLKYTKENFAIKDDEDIILCLDKSSWRKDYYPLYKANRKAVRDNSQINWPEFYNIINETLEVIQESFPFKVLSYYKAEGDDVMAVIAKHYHKKERILLITEDKDLRQSLMYPNVQAYRPIQRVFVTMSIEDLREWRVEHILLGDTSDNVPTIKTDTEFTPEFIKYLQENNIELPSEHTVWHFHKLSNKQALLDNYTGIDKYGKNNTFKAAGFGEKSAQQFVPDIIRNLKKNKMWIENFRRNRVLVQFKFIPSDIEQGILDAFELAASEQKGYDTAAMLQFFNENSLKQLSNNIDAFGVDSNDYSGYCKMDDWE